MRFVLNITPVENSKSVESNTKLIHNLQHLNILHSYIT